jgi:hypothetical protein
MIPQPLKGRPAAKPRNQFKPGGTIRRRFRRFHKDRLKLANLFYGCGQFFNIPIVFTDISVVNDV